MSLATRHYLGRESAVESDVVQAVEAAIDAGMDAREFIQSVREAWDLTLAAKAKRDDATFVKAMARDGGAR